MAATKSKASSKKVSKRVKASAAKSAAATATKGAVKKTLSKAAVAKSASKAAVEKSASQSAPKPEPGPKAKVNAKAKRVNVEPSANPTSKKSEKVVKATPAAPSAKAAKSEAVGPATGNGRALTVGDTVPAFEALDQNGALVTSASLAGAPYVIYFYPKDDTPGCRTEACGFRDEMAVFDERGVKLLGVSPDSTASHARFAQKYGLGFTLLADTEKKLVTLFGVWKLKQNYGREYWGVERSTFLVDGAGKIAKQWRGVKVAGHVSAVLDAAGQL